MFVREGPTLTRTRIGDIALLTSVGFLIDSGYKHCTPGVERMLARQICTKEQLSELARQKSNSSKPPFICTPESARLR